MFRILTAEGDKVYRKRLQQLLRQAGYQVIAAADGEEALKHLELEYVDAIILGTALTDMDANTLVKQLRDIYPDMAIVMMAETANLDGLRKGYLAGADEFLTRTVDDEELLLRIRALLRRVGKNYEKKLQIGKVLLDGNSLTVTRESEKQTLPKKEFWLLYKLLSYPENIFTRTQLMDEIWGVSTETSQSTLNVHINRLRNKFRDYPEFDLKAVRGMGYKAELRHEVGENR